MERKTKLFLSMILVVYFIFFLFSANHLYYADEVAFVEVATEIASGKAIGHFGFGAGMLTPEGDMLIHPPTYTYLLALFIFLFGPATLPIRAVSAIFTIGVIILVYLLTKKILETRNIENAETWATTASFIYAINPLTIQNSILVDIDGGMLNFFTLLFLYFYIYKKNLFYLVPSLFLVFYSKMSTPPLLFASLILLNLLSSEYKEIWRTIKLFLISGIGFFITFFLYAKTFGLDWTRLFMHNSALGAFKSFFSNPLITSLKSLWALKTLFYFATPFLIFLFLIVSVVIVKKIIKFRSTYIIQNKDILLLWIYAIMVFCLYFLVGQTAWNFPKYHIVALPSIVILIMFFTSKIKIHFKKILPITILAALLIFVYFIVFLGDPVLPEVEGRVVSSSLLQVSALVLIRILLYAILPIFLCIGLFGVFSKNKLWFILLFLLIVTSLYIDVIQARADYSTTNLYGDRGLKEVIEFMKDKPAQQILCYHYVGYYLGYMEISELETLLYTKAELIKLLHIDKINWVIINKEDFSFLGQDTFNAFKIERQIDNYYILKRKPAQIIINNVL